MLNRYSQYGWSKQAICQKWGISLTTFYRLKERRFVSEPNRKNLNSINDDEKETVRDYALSHTELNHREMAYRMLDENIAFMSPSSVYRILSECNLVSPRAMKDKADRWDPHARVTAPDEVWQTDLMTLNYRGREYYLLSYLDVYSRYIVYYQLCLSMTGYTISQATEEAIQQTGITPKKIQSDNGSPYISAEYRSVMGKLDIDHRFIHPHCPNENAEIERYHRTLRELVDPVDVSNFGHLEELIKEQIHYYNHIRYHSRIGFIPPFLKYRGNPEKVFKARELKLKRAKAKRLEINYQKLNEISNSRKSATSQVLN